MARMVGPTGYMYQVEYRIVQITSLFLLHCIRIFELSTVLGSIVTAESHRVIPTSSCNDTTNCTTISQLAADPRMFFVDDTTLILEPGSHYLHVDFEVYNVSSFALYGNDTQNTVRVTCDNDAKFKLIDIESVHVSGISLVNCVGNAFLFVDHFSFENSIVVVYEGPCETGLDLSWIKVVNISSSIFSMEHKHPHSIHGNCSFGSETDVMSVITFSNTDNVSISSVVFENITVTGDWQVLIYIENSVVAIQHTSFSNITNSGTVIVVIGDSMLIVNGCDFINNSFQGEIPNRGMITASDSTLIIVGTNFVNELTGGGTLLVKYSNLFMNGTRFLNNTVNVTGSTIMLLGNPIANINNCSLEANKGNVHGGVLTAIQSLVNIWDSVFYENRAIDSSGVILGYDCTIMIENTTFVANEAFSFASTLLVQSTKLTLTRSLFSMNVADGNACAAALVALLNSHIVIESTIFSDNIAVQGVNGGAVLILKSEASINSSEFYNNTAIFGGAIFIQEGNITVTNSNFVLNKAHSTYSVIKGTSMPGYKSKSVSAYGGALVAVTSTLILIKCQFRNNTATVDIYADTHSELADIMDCDLNSDSNLTYITNPEASGGAIYVSLGDSVLMVDGCVFEKNLVQVDSLIHNDTCVLYINPAVFGGALYSLTGTTNIKNSIFTSNHANVGYNVSVQSFEILPASSQGFAVAILMNNVAVVNTTSFFSNYAHYDNDGGGGGALFIFNTTHSEFINCIFSKNVASNHHLPHSLTAGTNPNCIGLMDFVEIRLFSSAIFIAKSKAVISNGTFTENEGFLCGIIGAVQESEVVIKDSKFSQNTANYHQIQFSAVNVINSTLSITNCTFENNTEGALSVWTSQAEVKSSIFTNNTKTLTGGSLYTKKSKVSLYNVTFSHNVLTSKQQSLSSLKTICPLTDTDHPPTIVNFELGKHYLGSTIFGEASTVVIDACSLTCNIMWVIHFMSSNLTIKDSIISENVAEYNGCVNADLHSILNIQHSTFTHNRCTSRDCLSGAVSVSNSSSEISNCIFKNNTSNLIGGAIYYWDGTVLMNNCTFVNNTAAKEGAAMYVDSTLLNSTGFLDLQYNTGSSIVTAVNSTLNFGDDTLVTNNCGSLFAFYSNVTFSGNTQFVDNTYKLASFISTEYKSVITGFHSAVVFSGVCLLENNTGITGSALLAKESKFFFYGNTTISQNSASLFGGGIYATQSELNFMGTTDVVGNVAEEKGGGIHIAGSTVRLVKGSLKFADNFARLGGAISFEQDAKLYIFKTTRECIAYSIGCINTYSSKWLKLQFINNTADYGGALYISDEENLNTCSSNSSKLSDCFFQALAVYAGNDNTSSNRIHINRRNTFFSNNMARIAGNSIYGGLLDRCGVNSFSEIFKARMVFDWEQEYLLSPLSYLLDYNVTNLERKQIDHEISSDPVRVCFCHKNVPDCSYKQPTQHVRKGETLSVSVVAVDQVNTTVPYTIVYSTVSSSAGLHEGQAIQTTNNSCTDLVYNVVSPHGNEQVQIYPEGPCRGLGISTVSFNITFKICPIGFIDTGSDCDCDPDIYPDYIATCSIDTESVLRKGNVWMAHINTTDDQGYVVYLNCPYDYCYSTNEAEVWINFNNINGSDSQCAYNHSGLLCGSCKEGLSLSFGSSQCKQCSNSYLALLVPFSIAGIVLVVLLLMCNMTVDKGTLNGVIFYANVIGSNRAVFYRFKSPIGNVLSVFIAWINLDFGFEVCFYDGMDGYVKTWLQLVFPLYIIFLVTMIIVGCEYSYTLHRLMYKKNPVATLSTLILLSYTKFLRVIISAFSLATIQYPSGRRAIVWLFDANVKYFGVKHTPLFIVSLIVLFIGLLYTLFLLFWQWLQRCPNRGCLKWINDSKLYSFMDAYQTPYNQKHRYWTGLLLLARVVLYLVSSFNIQHDPGINLLSVIFVASFLFYLSSNPTKAIYKTWPLNVLENSLFLNLILYSAVTMYVKMNEGNQVPIAYTSIGLTFCLFLVIIVHHTWSFLLSIHLRNLINTCRRHFGQTSNMYIPLSTDFNDEVEEPLGDPSYSEFEGAPIPIDTEENVDLLVSEDEATLESESSERNTSAF